MPTRNKKTARLVARLFKVGQQIELNGKWYCVDGGPETGGFGDVYFLRGLRDGSHYAMKVFRDFKEFTEGETIKTQREIVGKYRKLFEREWTNLERMSEDFPSRFPCFHGNGIYANRPYYLMEKLDPIDINELQGFKTDEERKVFICNILDAVAALHSRGLVHFDIKPNNILKRWDTKSYEKVTYVLGDFGSVHLEEQHTTKENRYSLNLLADGRQLQGRSVGYQDPADDKHTVHADIHAIGQVIRDMFKKDVPPLWGWIILKCISRNCGYRYNSVAELKDDVLQMERRGAAMLAASLNSLLSDEGITWANDMRRTFVSAAYKGSEKGTETSPFRTIAKAIKHAPPGTTILVGPGIYKENVLIEKKMLRLISTDGAENTVIRAVTMDSALKIRDAGDGSYIKGFTFTGGIGDAVKSNYVYDYRGGGIFVAGSATIADCIIKHNGHGEPKKNSATFGGGVYVTKGTVRVTNCLVEDNMAWASGAGMFVDGNGASLVVSCCTVRNNKTIPFFGARGGIGMANESVLSVSKCLVYDNVGDQIGAFSSVYAHETRAEVAESFVMNGVRSCNVHRFFDRQNNFNTIEAAKKVECGYRPPTD